MAGGELRVPLVYSLGHSSPLHFILNECIYERIVLSLSTSVFTSGRYLQYQTFFFKDIFLCLLIDIAVESATSPL